LAHSDVRAAAIFLIGLFAFGKKCDDLPYSASGDDQPAAEPGDDRAIFGILDKVPQPSKPGSHFLKTAQNTNFPRDLTYLKPARCMWLCKVEPQYRTKVFHVKHFCPIEPQNRTKPPLGGAQHPRAEPRQSLPQRFLRHIDGEFFRRRYSGLAGCAGRRPGRGPCRDGTLFQQDARDAAPAEMGVDALDEDGCEMLQLKCEAGLDPDDQRCRSWAIVHRAVPSPRRPLHLDRLRDRGESFAHDVVPKQDKTGLAKTLPRHNRIDRGLNELGQWPGPRIFARVTFPHRPHYRDLPGRGNQGRASIRAGAK
jgi:hypothetical protein